MRLVVEISLYPLCEHYIAPIAEFIERINSYSNLDVQTTSTSTTLAGEYEYLMKTLGDEMLRSYQQIGQAIFVCKFLNGDKMST